MRPAASRALLTLAACALLALGLAACGGGDEQDEAATTETGAAVQAPGGATQDGEAGKAPAAGEGAEREGGAPGPSNRQDGSGSGDGLSEEQVDLSVRPGSIEGARVTSTGAVQTVPPSQKSQQTAQENTYGSIRSFGGEAEGAEATNITFALVQYLDAKARGDWATACARIYSPLRENLEDPEQGQSCPQTFGQLMSRSPRSARTEQAKIDVSSVRRGEGNRAFVIYKTPETLSADMPMYVEDGVWKVGAIEAYALRPEQVG